MENGMYLNKGQLDSLTEIINDELLKRGFQVKLHIMVSPTRKIKIISDDFQTVPVLYKRIYIESQGEIRIKVLEDGNFEYSCGFDLHVVAKTFEGDTNIIDLFLIELHWSFDDEDDKVYISY